MKPLIRVALSIALPLTALAGCKAPGAPLSDSAVAEVSAHQKAPSLFAETKVLSSAPADGMANLAMNLRFQELNVPAFELLADDTERRRSIWSRAMVTLHSPTANTEFDESKHTRDMDLEALDRVTVPEEISTIGTTDRNGNNALNWPTGLTVDAEGNIFVANTDDGTVLKMNKRGEQRQVLTTELSRPRGIAVDASGNVFVTTTDGDNRLFKVPHQGGGTYGEKVELSNNLSDGHGVAVDKDGNIYVADTFNHRVVRFDASGNMTNVLRHKGFDEPRGVAVDKEGNVFVADRSRVYRFARPERNDIKRLVLEAIEKPGQLEGRVIFTKVNEPRGLTVDKNGVVFVSNSGGNHLVVLRPNTFDLGPDKEELSYEAYRIGKDLGLNFPGELEVDHEGQLVVVDTNNSRILKYTPEAQGLSGRFEFPPLRPGPNYTASLFLTGGGDRLDGPRKLRVEPSGLIASESLPAFDLKAGRNLLTFVVSMNGEFLRYDVLDSENGNKVGGNAITAGDTVTLATGMAKDQPGVERLELSLAGPCYEDRGEVQIGTLTEKATWDTFTWNTAARVDGPNGFRPAKLNGPDGTKDDPFPTAPGVVIIRAYDANNVEVARSEMKIHVFRAPKINVLIK